MQHSASQPLISVVLVSYNVRSHLLDTIRALLRSRDVSIELIVVDNASSDDSAAVVEAEFPKATLIRNRENAGFGRACNQGLEKASSELVLLLNPDVVVDPNCVRELARFVQSRPDAGAAGPRLERPDGRPDLAARRGFPTPSAAFYRFVGLSRIFAKSARFNRYNMGYLSPNEVHEIDSGTAACLMVRRTAVEQVGAFDPDYFMYGEDLDLCYRLKAKGWKIFYVPYAVAVHIKGASSGQRTAAMLHEFHRAMWIFHLKHYAQGLPAPVNGLVWAGIWTRWAALRLRATLNPRVTVSP
jgi:GT2 family glycosyltransferase